MSRMTWRDARRARVLLISAAILSATAAIHGAAHAQASPEQPADTPDELRDMPETLPELPQDKSEGAAPKTQVETKEEPAPDESAPAAGLRLEAQLLAAMAVPYGGAEHGAAFGFAITYGAGWGEIPILIGLDFMSIGRNNSASSRTEDVTKLPVTRSSSDRLLDFDLWLRVQPPRWPVRPYAEAFVGAKLVRTHWSIASDGELTKSGGDEEWTSAVGWGVGVDFMGLFNAVSTFSLTLGMRRLEGASVELPRPIVSDGHAVVRKRDVATNETIFTVGLCGRYDFAAGK
jgi:hypothetical protein